VRMFAAVVLASAIGSLAGPGFAQDVGQVTAPSEGRDAHRSRACVGPVCVSLERASQNQGTDANARAFSAPELPTPIPSDIPGGDEPGCIRGPVSNATGGGGVLTPGGTSTVVVTPAGGGSGGGGTTAIPLDSCPRTPPIPTPH
jgi:hypothetical protein